MANIPTISEIYSNLSDDLKNRLNLSDDKLKKVLDAITLSIAAQFKLTYLSLSDIQDNVFPDTANTGENGGTLDRLGNIYLNRIRRPSTSGIFSVNVTATGVTTLRNSLTFKSNDDSLNVGNLYVLDAEFETTGVDDVIEIRSLEGGTSTLLAVGDTLTITEPIIGVEQIVTVKEVVRQPFDGENVEDYRAAILQSIQLEPQGGSKTDYRIWSSDAQGVRAVYPFLKDTEAGTVQIYVESTDTTNNGVPSNSLLEDVAEVIELDPDTSLPLNERGRRPMQANIEVLPIQLIPVDVEIEDLQQNTTSILAAIKSNVEQYLYTVRPYVAGADLPRNKNDILYTARVQAVVTDVLDAGNFFNTFTVKVNGNSELNFKFSRRNIPYLRNVSIL